MTDNAASSIFEVVRDTAAMSPERLAIIVDDGEQRTYGELLDTAHRLAAAFLELGLRRGDRLALLLDNRAEWVEVYVAALGAGLVVVPANPGWTSPELAYLLENSGARALVCAGEMGARALALREEIASLETVIAVEPGDEDGLLDYASLLATKPVVGVTDVDQEDPAMIVYTSGTTSGRPKGVITSHRLLLEDIGLAYAAVMDTTARDRCMLVTPLFHNNALGACLSALAVGASVLFPRRFSASGFWRLVDTYRPTYLFTMAPILRILMAAEPTAIERLHGMRAMFVLAAGPEAGEIEARFETPVVDCYGMSECPCGTYTPLGEARRPGSAGRPFEHVELRIMKPDGDFAEADEVGEVVIAEDNVFGGYFNNPEETSRVLREGWFHTGDLGRLDADGFFYFVDRQKDIIRRGGENVSSQEVEAALMAHPAVADAAVVATPDPVLGERVAAVIVPQPGGPPTLQELRELAAEQLASYKLPERLVIREELPRTANGKIQKFALREQLVADEGAELTR